MVHGWCMDLANMPMNVSNILKWTSYENGRWIRWHWNATRYGRSCGEKSKDSRSPRFACARREQGEADANARDGSTARSVGAAEASKRPAGFGPGAHGGQPCIG